MPAMTEAAQTGKFQEIEDALFNVDPAATPKLSMMKNVGRQLNQSLASWMAEVYPATPSTSVPDGTAATNPSRVTRYEVQGYSHYFRQHYKVTPVASATNTAGVGRNELGNQRAKALILLRRQMEIQFGSADDTAADSGVVGSTARGGFVWLQSGAQATLPVNAAIRPGSSNNYTGAFASFSESSLVTMLNAMSAEKKAPVSLDAFVGMDLKAAIDVFTIVYPTASASAQPRVQYAVQGVDTFMQNVNFIDVSAGKVRIHLDYLLNYTTATGLPGTYSAKSGLFLDRSLWDLAFLWKPRHKALPDDGSGEQGIFEAHGLVRCLNPLGQGMVLPSS